MINNGQDWWTDEKVESTVTKHFIYAHLRSDQADQLTKPVFADLSDNTYLQCILLKAKRLFLILIHIGLPGDILRLIEDSYDDDNLPIDEDDVPSLGLSRGRSQNISLQFYRSQFKYLVRVVGEGEHIRYAPDECIPLQRVDSKTITSQNALQRGTLPSPINRTFLLKRVRLQEDRTEHDILSEVASSKSLCHEHVLSVFGSFAQHEYMCILMLPAGRYTLGTFLNDVPKAFEALPKPDRRNRLITWPHCLSNALAWLHEKGAHHGAIRPSRVLIDEDFHISLGYFEGDWALGSATPKNDLESYSYAAPELWKRSLTVRAQSTSGVSSLMGGRSAFGRRDAYRDLHAPSVEQKEHDTQKFNSVSIAKGDQYTFVPISKGISSRLRLEMAADVPSPLSKFSKRSASRELDRTDSPMESLRRQHSLCRRYDNSSGRSSNSSEANRKSETFRSEMLYPFQSETKNTAVQTWKSTAADLPATDVFGLAAVTMDLLTVLCSRTVSSFAKHRGAKYRQAGRGGGLADSSFHANLSQVGSWAEIVHKDAEKKLKKNSGDVFRAVGPILQVVIQCLDPEPQRRMKASTLSERLAAHLTEFAGIRDTPCTCNRESEPTKVQSDLPRTSTPAARLEDDLPVSSSLAQTASHTALREVQELYEPNVLDSRHDSMASDTYVTSSAPRTSAGTSATYYQSSHTAGSHYNDEKYDEYDVAADPNSIETQFVQVKPKEKGVGRLLIDFTEDEGLGDIVSMNFPTDTGMDSTYIDGLHSRPDTSHSNKTTKSQFSLYPAAFPPPSRQLPVSPMHSRSKSHKNTKRYAAPPSVYQANDLLALAAGDLSIDGKTISSPSHPNTTNRYAYQNPKEWE